MSACVGDGDIVLADRNCHKSIEQGLAMTGGIPVFFTPSRNRYGVIGPIAPEQFTARSIAASIRSNALVKETKNERPGLRGHHQLHL